MAKYIDADKLMKKLDNLRPANLNTLYAVESIICEMPAAYDVDAVIKEIQKVNFQNASQHARVISIIKRGGKRG